MLRLAVLASSLCACGSVSGDKKPDARMIDGPDIDAPADMMLDAFSIAAFGTPTPLTALNTSGVNDDDPCVTADERELFFSSARTGGMGADDIWVSTRATTSAAWGVPVAVTDLNSPAGEAHPRISPDGLTIYFTSARTGGPGGLDVYISARATRTSPWSTPTLVTELSSNSNEYTATPDPTGLILILDSDRSGASGRDLYMSTRASTSAAWGIPALITALNTNAGEQDGMLVNGGKAMYYAGADEIYVSRRATTADPFVTSSLVVELNSTAPDLDPWVTQDEKTIYFSSRRLAGDDDLFMATRP